MDNSADFARAFGNALQDFLEARGITITDAAARIGLEQATGKQRIHTYVHDSSSGRRAMPSAEVLYLTCSKLGFSFEYRGFKITAETAGGPPRPPTTQQSQQLLLPLNRQFDLTDERGTVSLSVKRPPGRVEVSLSLRTAL